MSLQTYIYTCNNNTNNSNNAYNNNVYNNNVYNNNICAMQYWDTHPLGLPLIIKRYAYIIYIYDTYVSVYMHI